MHLPRLPRCALILGLILNAWTAQAAAPKADVPGARDHPVLQRFSGSLLVGYAQQDWDQRQFPDARGAAKDDKRFANPVAVEGKVTRLYYLAPLGKSPLEVFRNYQQALQAAGFKTTWTCETEARAASGPTSHWTAISVPKACAGPRATCPAWTPSKRAAAGTWRWR